VGLVDASVEHTGGGGGGGRAAAVTSAPFCRSRNSQEEGVVDAEACRLWPWPRGKVQCGVDLGGGGGGVGCLRRPLRGPPPPPSFVGEDTEEVRLRCVCVWPLKEPPTKEPLAGLSCEEEEAAFPDGSKGCLRLAVLALDSRWHETEK